MADIEEKHSALRDKKPNHMQLHPLWLQQLYYLSAVGKPWRADPPKQTTRVQTTAKAPKTKTFEAYIARHVDSKLRATVCNTCVDAPV